MAYSTRCWQRFGDAGTTSDKGEPHVAPKTLDVMPEWSSSPAATLAELRKFADDEALMPWQRGHVADVLHIPQPQAAGLMTAVAERGLVLPYLGGSAQLRLAYLVGEERPGGSSILPPPSIQSLTTRDCYARRDGWLCHLCGRKTRDGYDTPREWSSLDHLVPRSEGGSDYPSNIKTAHISCNKARRVRPVAEFAGSPLTRIAEGRWP